MNGWLIGMLITTVRLRRILRVLRQVGVVFFGAVCGTATKPTSDRPVGTEAIQSSRTTTTDFAAPARLNHLIAGFFKLDR